NYIAKVDGPRSFPWRIAVITDNDAKLAESNLSYLLGEPSRLDDISWIKPGKVAWDWWNAWNLDGVDFETGVNNDTYKAYIDFAANKGIEYVILDEGWAVNKKADLMQVVDEIDLKELIDYAAARNVGIVLWAGYYAFDRDMENVCRHYSDMGVKGFKVDFMDRDDQQMTDFNYRAAATAAKHHLFLDLHGTHKPAGLNRTYPNVLNFEGVNGLEQMKWSPKTLNQVEYDALIPFIRQVSGPMDYTQGAMRNATQKKYFPCCNVRMSQGTRCRQLALYMVFDSPFNMLCDTPSNYMREEECTDFIAEVPTVWDETRVIDGAMGDYIVTARRSGDTWYVGGITDWTPRDMTIDCSFLEPGATYTATIFKDGVNAHRIARDYKRENASLKADDKLKMHLAPGGGFAIKLQKNQ
ncbi:MAG: glycoside hydrolase family 97 catalytic domain-containing protein, partial [Muribaculaceae bacterium]|nr:glycoside hydrolase family 97 catalytic domain-containing protein [Muribaculaceae bacterium]